MLSISYIFLLPYSLSFITLLTTVYSLSYILLCLLLYHDPREAVWSIKIGEKKILIIVFFLKMRQSDEKNPPGK